MSTVVDASAGLPVVAAGDFNSSPRVKGQERASREFLRRMRDEFGLVSAYHRHFGVEPGEERHPTYYHRYSEAAPFHLDYCFAPDRWAGTLTSVEVGAFED